jgi:hypothetical protein
VIPLTHICDNCDVCAYVACDGFTGSDTTIGIESYHLLMFKPF